MTTQDFFPWLTSLIGYGFSTAVRIAKRLVVHFCCMLTALLVAGTLDGVAGFFVGWIAVYAGLICFIPMSGTEAFAERVIPPVAGIALAVCWVIWGVPWQFTLFWGGLAAWLTRLALRREMGWEWLTVPLILAGLSAYMVFSPSKGANIAAAPFWSFPLFIIAGYAAARLYVRVLGRTIRAELLRTSCRKLRGKLASATLPDTLRVGVTQLEKQGSLLLESGAVLEAEYESLIRSLADSADMVAVTGIHSKERRIRDVEARICDLNQDLHERLEALRRQRVPQDKSPLESRLEAFAESADALLAKAVPLPEDIRSHVAGIGRTAQAIVRCMRDDPNDVAAGDRFLSRYLKAAHTVVDEHVRLSARNDPDAGTAELLSRSRDLLQRLESGFIQEHAGLLRNNAINFTAELNVLDKLLKMDGK